MTTLRLPGLLIVVVSLVGCGGAAPPPPAPAPAPDATSAVAYSKDLTPAERDEFYHLAEGSEMLPVHWFFALENEAGDGLFADNLERFGLIPDAVSTANPYGLPVGITAAETRDLRFTGVPMVGVTCAACHVSEVVYNGKRTRLDGGSSHADVEAFSLGVARVLTGTLENPEKFLRFVDRLRDRAPSEVLADDRAKRAATVFKAAPPLAGPPPASAFDRLAMDGLRRLLERERRARAVDLHANRPTAPGAHVAAAATDVRARLTAGLTPAVLDAHTPTVPADGSAIAAAVPPAELRAHMHAFLADAVVTLRLLKARAGLRTEMTALLNEQTTQPGFGRIDAFGGFRLMLFGETPIAAPVGYPDIWSLAATEWLHWDANTTSVIERNIGQSLGMGAVLDRKTMSSTVRIENLNRLEELALKTKPPSWESVIGPIDKAAADRGAALFQTNCARCHGPAGAPAVTPTLEEIGTDPNRAMSFAQPIKGKPFADSLGEILSRVKTQTAKDSGITPEQLATFEGKRVAKWRTVGAYPARPLVGVWASAPYLHNSSVPTLADLLSPAASRPIMFFTGSKEYDAVKMGYVTTERPGSFMFDTKLPGNGNGGHTYGTQLSPTERAALLEYLKQK